MTGSSGCTPVAGRSPAGPDGADPLSAPFGVPSSLLMSAGSTARPVRREPLHVWQMSAVERVYLDDRTTVILKTAAEPFTREADTLRHAAAHDVPVPTVLSSSHLEGWPLAMLLEDLGEHPEEDAPLTVGARAAVAVHACPPISDLPVMDAAALAQLPMQALDTLEALESQDRWPDAQELRAALEQIAEAAPQRAEGTDIPPYGMCHSEFHPTSLLEKDGTAVILDWARAFTGPGLLDLASWEDTPKPLNLAAITAMLDAYVAAGGTTSALRIRGGLPAAQWAGGWHRMWIAEWYLQQASHWIPDPANDVASQRTVRRHIQEAVQCLT
jgi:hypothetical protein